MQYADTFSTQIWQLSISGNVPGWRKRRGENGSSYPWVRTLMDTRLWDKVDPVSCQLRKLVGHMKKTREIHRLLEALRDAAQAPNLLSKARVKSTSRQRNAVQRHSSEKLVYGTTKLAMGTTNHKPPGYDP